MKTSSSKLLLRFAAVASAAAALALPDSAQAQSWTGANATANGWGAASNWSSLPAFNNTTDVTFNVLTRPNPDIGGNRTIRSLAYGVDIDSAVGINFQDFNTGTLRNLTFDTDVVGGNASISVASGATGNITIGNATSTSGTIGSIILADNLLVTHNGTGTLSFNRAITGSGFGITKNGTGSMLFNSIGSQPNTFSGNLTINEGRVIAGAFVAATDINNAANVNLNGGVLEIRGTGATKDYTTVGINVTSASTLAYNNTSLTNFRADISGAGAFAVGANLTLQNISANTTATNAFNITRNMTGTGNVIVETYNNVSSNSTSFTAGRISLGGNNTSWSGNLVVRQGTAEISGNQTASPLNAGSGTLIIGETGNSLGAGLLISQTGTGNATVTLNNNMIVRADGFRTLRTGVGRFSAGSDSSITLNGTLALEGNLNIDTNFSNNDRRYTLNGVVSGVGGLNITASATGTGFVRLTGNNTYSGATTIGSNASLNIQSASGNAIGDSSAVVFNGTSGGVLQFNSTNETIGSLASTGAVGTVGLGNNTLTTGGDNTSTSYGGAITGTSSSGVTKVGSGTMTFTSAQAYTGTTTVSEGTLLLASGASLASTNIQVASGASLDVTALAGGLTIASGNRVGGDGTISGNISLASGAQFIFTLGAILDVTGTVSLDNSFSIASLVNANGTAIDWSVVSNGTYTLIGTTASSFANITNFGLANAATGLAGGKSAYFQNGSLELVVIPEPATWALFALGLTTMVVFRRRRCN